MAITHASLSEIWKDNNRRIPFLRYPDIQAERHENERLFAIGTEGRAYEFSTEEEYIAVQQALGVVINVFGVKP